ncbi:hypothetical protein HDU93_008941 [Gonapodya sp. JEL0774]|nr:hypothetical protein HDU93_008941 [Gonapodya sp. JEL0774]
MGRATSVLSQELADQMIKAFESDPHPPTSPTLPSFLRSLLTSGRVLESDVINLRMLLLHFRRLRDLREFCFDQGMWYLMGPIVFRAATCVGGRKGGAGLLIVLDVEDARSVPERGILVQRKRPTGGFANDQNASVGLQTVTGGPGGRSTLPGHLHRGSVLPAAPNAVTSATMVTGTGRLSFETEETSGVRGAGIVGIQVVGAGDAAGGRNSRRPSMASQNVKPDTNLRRTSVTATGRQQSAGRHNSAGLQRSAVKKGVRISSAGRSSRGNLVSGGGMKVKMGLSAAFADEEEPKQDKSVSAPLSAIHTVRLDAPTAAANLPLPLHTEFHHDAVQLPIRRPRVAFTRRASVATPLSINGTFGKPLDPGSTWIDWAETLDYRGMVETVFCTEHVLSPVAGLLGVMVDRWDDIFGDSDGQAGERLEEEQNAWVGRMMVGTAV